MGRHLSNGCGPSEAGAAAASRTTSRWAQKEPQQQRLLISSNHRQHNESYLISSSRLAAASILTTAANASQQASASGSPSAAPASTSAHSGNQIPLLSNAQLQSQHHFSGHDNGPILYDNLNRTSAIDDIRSVVIYIFIASIFFSFFLILPGIRNEKFPSFFCITTSLLVTSILIISLNGTTWHVGEAPISAPYKAFSRDRIQGDLSVRIGLQSVNISLKAHKYYILHSTDGPMIMENTHKYSLLQRPLMMMMAPVPTTPSASSHPQDETNGSLLPSSGDHQTLNAAASDLVNHGQRPQKATNQLETETNLADELLAGGTSDGGISVDTELEAEEQFTGNNKSQRGGSSSVEKHPKSADFVGDERDEKEDKDSPQVSTRRIVRSSSEQQDHSNKRKASNAPRPRRQSGRTKETAAPANTETTPQSKPKYTIKRVYVDINYNERFYMIGPMQMRREYHRALERGLPYPILTVVEYLSQDEAGFSWSRKYRAAGYYTTMLLWISASVCLLMFCLHCAAPKYGIYSMQALGLLMLLTNLNYTYLVPTGNQRLVILFEGQSLTFRYGWNFWLNLIGGCVALAVGTLFLVIDRVFPNFIFTTVLDVDFDSTCQKTNYERKYKILGRRQRQATTSDDSADEDEGKQSELNSSSTANGHTTREANHAGGPWSSRAHHARRPKLPPFMRQELKKRRSQAQAGTTTTAIKGHEHVLNDKDGLASDYPLSHEGHIADAGGGGHRRPLHPDGGRKIWNSDNSKAFSSSTTREQSLAGQHKLKGTKTTGDRNHAAAAVGLVIDKEPASAERRRAINADDHRSPRDHNGAAGPLHTIRL